MTNRERILTALKEKGLIYIGKHGKNFNRKRGRTTHHRCVNCHWSKCRC